MLGKALGPYRIESELGSGGMGTVYLATAREGSGVPQGARVALKVVQPQLARSPEFFARFEREAEIGMAVRHPNVVRTLGVGREDGWPYLVMEYVEGQTLAALVAELGRLPEELCRHVGRETCKALVAIHTAGAVHRDLKPDNVLITPDDVVKVMDLGVARIVDEATRLSQTGAFVGSLDYAAPEQFRGGKVAAVVEIGRIGSGQTRQIGLGPLHGVQRTLAVRIGSRCIERLKTQRCPRGHARVDVA